MMINTEASRLHIHLDPLGGIAGDMFIAAMSNAFPEIKSRIERVIAEANFAGVSIAFKAKNDGVLVGTHFQVFDSEHAHSHSSHGQADADEHAHLH